MIQFDSILTIRSASPMATTLPIDLCKSSINSNPLTTMEISVILYLGFKKPQTPAKRRPPMSLTKNDVVEQLHSELGFPKKQSIESLESLIELIKATLESGEDVLVSGFGKFCVKTKHQRRGRNPATGEDLILDPRKIVTFKCSGKLKDRINGS
jgi:integration host factor subunit alpha